MDISSVFNDVIATLIATAIIAVVTLGIRKLKFKYEENKLVFLPNLFFYIDFFLTTINCLRLNLNNLNVIDVVCIILDIFFTVVMYENVKSHTYQSATNSNNIKN